MEHIYFDQNITEKICKNCDFLHLFGQKYLSTERQLVITPFCLIEFCGILVQNCFNQNTSQYRVNSSGNPSEEVQKAQTYYQYHVRSNIIEYLKKHLKNKKEYIKTRWGLNMIYKSYERYLNRPNAGKEITYSVSNDRAYAIPLETFKHKDTYFDIFFIAGIILGRNSHTPCLRLFLKSVKKLPISQDEKINNMRLNVLNKIEKIDVHRDSDLIDTELIQLAVLGYHNHPLHIFTTDDEKSIKDRLYFTYFLIYATIQQAKSLVENFDDVEATRNNTPQIVLKFWQRVANYQFRFGKISIIDKSGKLKQNINVRTLVSTFGI